MRSLVESLLHPQRQPPEPVTVNLVRVLLVGSGAWAVALFVTAALAAAGSIDWIATWVSGCGVAIGGGALLWARRRPATRAVGQVGPADVSDQPVD